MALLSSPLTEIRPRYDVVVIGSGYGGSIAACRLARARHPDGSKVTVCLLERGREIPVGRFPDTLAKAKDELQADLEVKRVGREDALFEYRMGKEISVFQGCGLGGTSLINANVSLRPDRRLWSDERWPRALRDDLEGGVEEGFRRAEEMLRPVPYPAATEPFLTKFDNLRASAKAMGKESSVGRPPINVNFVKGENHVGVHQEACNGCGDCVSGCNVGAKNTLMMNYLPDARRHGAEIFTGAGARRVAKHGDEWRVYYRPVGCGRDAFDAADLFVTAGVVVVAAGTLGTGEILLRSKDRGLPCSAQLGKRFTGNGDVLGFGYNMDRRVHGIGMGDRDVDPDRPVGPCISGIIDLRASAEDPEDGFVIEEGAIPGALAELLPTSMKAAAKLIGKDTDRGFGDWLKEKLRGLTSVLFGAYRGATAHTQTYLIMANDDAGGTLEFADDRVSVRWPNVGKDPLFKKLNGALEDATRAHGGTYVPSPLYNRAFGFDLLTVHPLGGCPMGEDAERGAVDHKGRLFSGRAGDAVHEGLYVTDGAVMPRPVGVNPLLTISAVAERSVRLLAEDRGWSVEDALPGEGEVVDGRPGSAGTEIRFTERMAGHCSTGTLEDPRAAEEAGREEESPCAFVLTIRTGDLDLMVEDEKHEAGMFGTVTAPALSAEAMTVHGGKFRLFEDVTGPNGPMKRMLYRMDLASVEGKTFHFEGEKHIRNDTGIDVWEDTTTLLISIREGGPTGEVRARGVLHIEPEDFAKQLGTMRAREPDGSASLAGQARFGKFFAGALWETYGPEGLKGPGKMILPRGLGSRIVPLKAGDGLDLNLVNVRGEDAPTKEPVLLVHGAGVRADIFRAPVETSVVDALVDAGHDVWLLNWRASIEFPPNPWTLDQAAVHDHPAAVKKVVQETGAKSIKAIVHCQGSTSFTMSALAGLVPEVTTIVTNAVSLHTVVPRWSAMKLRFAVPPMSLFLPYMNPRWGERAPGLLAKAVAGMVKATHRECENGVCRMVSFTYGAGSPALWRHENITDETHDWLKDEFAAVPLRFFKQMGKCVKRGNLVSYEEFDELPRDFAAVPPRTDARFVFLTGAKNLCFLPESQVRSHEWFVGHGRADHALHVLPEYSHLDIFMGTHSARDVFPIILEELAR